MVGLNGLEFISGLITGARADQLLTQMKALDDDLTKLLDDVAASDDLVKGLVETPELVEGWKVLNQVGEVDLGTRLDDIEFVHQYQLDNPAKTFDDIKTDIEDAGGFNAWKSSQSVGTYSTQIRWGIHDIDARPLGDMGFWGTRITQSDARVEAFELKINPNNESFYVPHPEGGYVQFEGLVANTLMDGKLIKQVDNSIYNVMDKPEFLRQKVLDEAIRQVTAAESKGLSVEWLVSEQRAVDQLTQFFSQNDVNITVKYLAE